MKIRTGILIGLAVLLPTSFLIARIRSNDPPEKEMREAAQTLAEADLVRAREYAGDTYRKARQQYDSAMMEWRMQNERFVLFRDYTLVRDRAMRSVELSDRSIREASRHKTATRESLDRRISELTKEIRRLDQRHGRMPQSESDRRETMEYKLHLSEAKQAFRNGAYGLCDTYLDQAEALVRESYGRNETVLSDYYASYPDWKQWTEEAISRSGKDGSVVLVVDKMARELHVYKKGKHVQTYPVELGKNWMGTKLQKGDKATPEGHYRVVEKLENGRTKYHRALLLDYPNAEDTKRFRNNKKNGRIPGDAEIGGLIEIHGKGGKGSDWTDGCVALRNEDMDAVFAACPNGTRVTIVGSTRPLEDAE